MVKAKLHRTLPSCFSINYMARKHYEAPDTIISNLNIFVSGRPARISFTHISTYEGSHTGRGSMLVTSNPDLQDAIEHSALFGRRIFLFSTEEETRPSEEASGENENEVVVVPETEVGSYSDARDYLVTHFGYDKSAFPNKRAITKAAKAHNIEFAALKE